MAKTSTNKTLEERIEVFSTQIRERAEGVYPDEMINDFIEYWTEYNERGIKFRREKETTWDTMKRLATWVRLSRGRYQKLQTNDKIKDVRKQFGL